MIFSPFLTKNFQTRSPAERNNDFHAKMLLETCSATSNYPWNWLSCNQNMYCGLYMKKIKKIEQIRHFSALFGGVLVQFLHGPLVKMEIMTFSPKYALFSVNVPAWIIKILKRRKNCVFSLCMTRKNVSVLSLSTRNTPWSFFKVLKKMFFWNLSWI